jgi:hypothetical protein
MANYLLYINKLLIGVLDNFTYERIPDIHTYMSPAGYVQKSASTNFTDYLKLQTEIPLPGFENFKIIENSFPPFDVLIEGNDLKHSFQANIIEYTFSMYGNGHIANIVFRIMGEFETTANSETATINEVLKLQQAKWKNTLEEKLNKDFSTDGFLGKIKWSVDDSINDEELSIEDNGNTAIGITAPTSTFTIVNKNSENIGIGTTSFHTEFSKSNIQDIISEKLKETIFEKIKGELVIPSFQGDAKFEPDVKISKKEKTKPKRKLILS